MRLLLVEDDGMVGQAVREGLRQDGFSIDWVQDGAAAETALRTEPYDCLLLDLGLPKKSGLDVLRGLRSRRNAIPVVVITARDAVPDRIAGLDAGADDYVVKPFDLEEVAARVRAVVRRRQGRGEPEIEHRGLVLKPAARQAEFRGAPLQLSRREFAVLEALAARPGSILSRQQIEQHVYGWGEEVESNAVEVFVHSIRKKLGPDFIVTVRGAGYMVPK
ncbi:MAG TPA: response regulator transcription factor [Burkholderiales bacterium]|jgi:DNA-binding response OmpR family regulator|nr:response regulator transcription factor [Burkholderiales bacterium]